MSKLYATMTTAGMYGGTMRFPVEVGEMPEHDGYYTNTVPTFDTSGPAIRLAQKLHDEEREIRRRRKSTPADRKRKKLERQNRRKARV